MSTLTCGFIGLGLIGGSIAKAIRNAIPNAQIIAYDTNTTSLTLALNEHVVDRTYPVNHMLILRMRLHIFVRSGSA